MHWVTIRPQDLRTADRARLESFKAKLKDGTISDEQIQDLAREFIDLCVTAIVDNNPVESDAP